jgi:hypothetical protein
MASPDFVQSLFMRAHAYFADDEHRHRVRREHGASSPKPLRCVEGLLRPMVMNALKKN